MTAKTRSAKPANTRWVDADLDELKLSPEVAAYLDARGYPVPDCPPLWKTPEPRNAPGAAFDFARVDRVIASFKRLRHTKGRFAGQPFEPDTWQVAYTLAPIFGWVHPSPDTGDYVRIITTAWIELPRKNGKTTLASGIGIYLTGADGEAGAQIICAATSRDQADLAFSPMLQVVKGSPALRKHFTTTKKKIIHNASGSTFESVANAADAQHGRDIHGGVIDEIHLHKNNDLIEAIETGTGSRMQPLVCSITTADSGRRHTPYDDRRTRIEKLVRGSLKDATTYGVIFAAEKDDDPFAETTWRKANPGYGVSPTKRDMMEKANKAKDSPAQLASFQRLHLGLRTKQEFRYLDLDAWDRNASIVVPERLKGRDCYGGLDLGSTSDLTALAWLFPDGDAFDVLIRAWAPEDSIEDLDHRTANAASVWVKEGWLKTTPGNVTDYDFIQGQIARDRDQFNVQEIAYDRWNATQLVNDLTTEGAPMVSMGQGFVGMSAPTKDLQRLVLTGTPEKPIIRHGGNPLLRWTVDNFAVVMDDAGNVKPSKKNAADKIDPVVALIMGLSRAVAAREAEFQSAYDDPDSDGLMIV
jgi:phage terminase large subunit-like protein